MSNLFRIFIDNEYNENQTNRTKRIKLKSCGHIFHHYCIEEYISRCNANEYMKTENNDKYFMSVLQYKE